MVVSKQNKKINQEKFPAKKANPLPMMIPETDSGNVLNRAASSQIAVLLITVN